MAMMRLCQVLPLPEKYSQTAQRSPAWPSVAQRPSGAADSGAVLVLPTVARSVVGDTTGR